MVKPIFNGELTREITLKLSPRADGGLRICSDDVPGLILSGRYPAAVLAGVWQAMKTLSAHEEPMQR